MKRNARRVALEVRVSYRTMLVTPMGDEIESFALKGWEVSHRRREVAPLIARGWEFKIERHATVTRVEACYYCQARPAIWEQDCDGWYSTVVCDSDQCRQGRNPDNHEWVAGTAPLWGPGHPEFDRMEAESIATGYECRFDNGMHAAWFRSRLRRYALHPAAEVEAVRILPNVVDRAYLDMFRIGGFEAHYVLAAIGRVGRLETDTDRENRAAVLMALSGAGIPTWSAEPYAFVDLPAFGPDEPLF